MKTIERAMCKAAKAHKNWRSGNTCVVADEESVRVYLHGNLIYEENGNGRAFTLAGWNTPTTRSRLNALGCGVSQHNWEPQHNGAAISSREWITL